MTGQSPQQPHRSYGDLAEHNIPVPTVRRRDRVLFLLRSAGEAVTAAELVDNLRQNRLRDYNSGLAYKDLQALERHGLVRRDYRRPERWTAA